MLCSTFFMGLLFHMFQLFHMAASLKLTVFIDSPTSHTWIPGTDATNRFLPVT